jgi:hypothetical protein
VGCHAGQPPTEHASIIAQARHHGKAFVGPETGLREKLPDCDGLARKHA